MINDKMKKKDDFKEKLINRSFNAIEQKRKEFENNPSNSKHYYKKLKRLITEQINLDLSNYRDNYLKRRITHRISFINITSFKDYIVYLRNHPEEKKKIKDNLTIHTTNWLRDITPFKILEKDIFPKIIKKKLKLSRDKQIIRILSAPCSSGQEPYSIAMIIEEIIKKKKLSINFKIFACDIEPNILEKARAGIYYKKYMKNIPKPYIKRYFTHIKENYYKIKPEIRKRVSFFKHNLFKPLPSYLKKIDLILCRNLLIYIPRKRQIEILKHLKVILSKEGYLMLGKTESFLIINPDKEIVAENATEHIYKLKVK